MLAHACPFFLIPAYPGAPSEASVASRVRHYKCLTFAYGGSRFHVRGHTCSDWSTLTDQAGHRLVKFPFLNALPVPMLIQVLKNSDFA